MELLFAPGEEGSLHSALVLGPWFLSLLCLGWLNGLWLMWWDMRLPKPAWAGSPLPSPRAQGCWQ